MLAERIHKRAGFLCACDWCLECLIYLTFYGLYICSLGDCRISGIDVIAAGALACLQARAALLSVAFRSFFRSLDMGFLWRGGQIGFSLEFDHHIRTVLSYT